MCCSNSIRAMSYVIGKAWRYFSWTETDLMRKTCSSSSHTLWSNSPTTTLTPLRNSLDRGEKCRIHDNPLRFLYNKPSNNIPISVRVGNRHKQPSNCSTKEAMGVHREVSTVLWEWRKAVCSGHYPAISQDGPSTEMRAPVLQGDLSIDNTSLREKFNIYTAEKIHTDASLMHKTYLDVTDSSRGAGGFFCQFSTSGNNDTLIIKNTPSS